MRLYLFAISALVLSACGSVRNSQKTQSARTKSPITPMIDAQMPKSLRDGIKAFEAGRDTDAYRLFRQTQKNPRVIGGVDTLTIT